MTTKPTRGADGNCLMCRGPNWTLLHRSDDKEYHCKPGEWDIVRCDQCGHVSLHPIPQADEVASLYPATYYTVNRNSPLFSQGVQALIAEALRRELQRRTQATEKRNARTPRP